MNYSDLSSEEQEIINSLRGMNQSRRNAVMASQNSFIQWLKEAISWVWEIVQIAGMARDIYLVVRSFF